MNVNTYSAVVNIGIFNWCHLRCWLSYYPEGMTLHCHKTGVCFRCNKKTNLTLVPYPRYYITKYSFSLRPHNPTETKIEKTSYITRILTLAVCGPFSESADAGGVSWPFKRFITKKYQVEINTTERWLHSTPKKAYSNKTWAESFLENNEHFVDW